MASVRDIGRLDASVGFPSPLREEVDRAPARRMELISEIADPDQALAFR